MKRWHILLLDASLLLLFPLFYLLSGLMLNGLSPCLLSRTGILCPACGGTRFMKHFTQFQFVSAFKSNPYFFITALVCAGYIIVLNISVLSNGRHCSKLLKKICKPSFIILWAIGFVIFGALRNIL